MDIKDSRQTKLPLEQPKPAVQAKPPRILRLAQVRELTGLGRSCIYQLQAENLFPRRITKNLRPTARGVIEWSATKSTQTARANLNSPPRSG